MGEGEKLLMHVDRPHGQRICQAFDALALVALREKCQQAAALWHQKPKGRGRIVEPRTTLSQFLQGRRHQGGCMILEALEDVHIATQDLRPARRTLWVYRIR